MIWRARWVAYYNANAARFDGKAPQNETTVASTLDKLGI